MSSNALVRDVGLFFGTMLLGWLGGVFCGFFILAFGDFAGTTGEYFGYWNPDAALGLAEIYGAPIGALLFPIGYFVLLRRASFFPMLCGAALGTILGGCFGALIGPFTSVFTGFVGFFISCVCVGASSPDAREAD